MLRAALLNSRLCYPNWLTSTHRWSWLPRSPNKSPAPYSKRGNRGNALRSKFGTSSRAYGNSLSPVDPLLLGWQPSRGEIVGLSATYRGGIEVDTDVNMARRLAAVAVA